MRPILLLLFFTPVYVFSQVEDSTVFIYHFNDSTRYTSDGLTFELIPEKKIKRERVRLTAALLCLTLGPFGVHRLYLGTSTSVPVFYTLTLGGGLGILPLADFFLIVFSKDLDQYKDNPNVFMWTEK